MTITPKKYPQTSLSDEEYEAILRGKELDYEDARDLSPFYAMENQ